jgi:hypothetical protein
LKRHQENAFISFHASPEFNTMKLRLPLSRNISADLVKHNLVRTVS